MNLNRARRIIDRHIQHGDMAAAAREMGVQWQTVQQHIRGNRQTAPAAGKYIIALAKAIRDRKQREREADDATADAIRKILDFS